MKINHELCTHSQLKGFKIGTRNLAKSYVGVPMADRIGRKDGQLFSTGF